MALLNFANTYAGYFGLVAALGIPIYGIREIAKCNNYLKQQEKLFSEICDGMLKKSQTPRKAD